MAILSEKAVWISSRKPCGFPSRDKKWQSQWHSDYSASREWRFMVGGRNQGERSSSFLDPQTTGTSFQARKSDVGCIHYWESVQPF